MARCQVLIPTTVLLAGIGLVAGGCGNGGPRLLRSIAVSPARADARTFPTRQVQFTAVGTYSQPPSPTPITQSEQRGWSSSDPTVAPISQSGLAQCKPGALGLVTVKAFACCAPCIGTECTAELLMGSAQLSCP